MTRGRRRFDEESIKHYVVDCGLGDYEIAKLCNTDRLTVRRNRLKFTGVTRPKLCGRDGELIAIDTLNKLGFSCDDMNAKDVHSDYDILVDGKVRIEVKTSMCDGISWKFTLTTRHHKSIDNSGRYAPTRGTRYAKLISRYSDFLLLIGLDGDDKYYFVVPSSEIKDGQQTISIAKSLNTKLSSFKDRFDLLRRC